MQETIALIMQFIQSRNWETDKAGSFAKSISIEAAELLEIFQWDDPTFEELKADPERFEHTRQELADVLIYCYQMAHHLDLDPKEIIRKKLELQTKKYPLEN